MQSWNLHLPFYRCLLFKISSAWPETKKRKPLYLMTRVIKTQVFCYLQFCCQNKNYLDLIAWLWVFVFLRPANVSTIPSLNLLKTSATFTFSVYINYVSKLGKPICTFFLVQCQQKQLFFNIQSWFYSDIPETSSVLHQILIHSWIHHLGGITCSSSVILE